MGKMIIGVRLEDKNKWERRVPFTPLAVSEFQKEGIPFLIQSSPNRVFKDEEYRAVGAEVDRDLSKAGMIFAVKEVPVDLIENDKVYIFFSHTIKGQSYNMPLLKKIMDSGATLVDYERIVDDQGRRLVFFGAHAGYAGMIDTLHLLGERHASLGIKCRFLKVQMAYKYGSLEEAKSEIHGISKGILEQGFSDPVIFGFAGYGNVSRGAQDILEELPVKEITPEELLAIRESGKGPHKCVYKVVFKEADMFERLDGSAFELQTYYDQPELFRSKFDQYVPHLNVLVNAIYWTEKYPRIVTKQLIKELWEKGGNRPEIIGDISIDIDGSIECSYKATYSDDPAYVYLPASDSFRNGVTGKGPVIMAVDNLPCELPLESSKHFSLALKSFVPEMASADWKVDFQDLKIPGPIKSAVIVYKGELTPDFTYMKKFLNS